MAHPRYFRFFRTEVLARGKDVLLHRNILISLAAGVVAPTLAIVTPRLSSDTTSFTALGTATLTFAALSFGGAITCATLMAGLPPDRLMQTMAVNSENGPVLFVPSPDGVRSTADATRATPTDFPKGFRSLYAELIFVYQWTAVAQLVLAAVSLLCIALLGDSELSPTKFNLASYIGLVLLTGCSTLAVLQLASSIRTLGQVARLRDQFLRSDLLNSSTEAGPRQTEA